MNFFNINKNRFLLKLLIATLYCSALKAQNITWRELDAKAKTIDSVVYKTAGNQSLKGYYFIPEIKKRNKRLPAIIFIHGGSWTGGDANVFFAYAAYFAKKNIVTISINYRLLSQQGNQISDCIEDCHSAISFFKANANKFLIDTNKIIICGESAGGHLAAMMQMMDESQGISGKSLAPIKPAALILLNPVLNLNTSIFLKYLDGNLVRSKARVLDTNILFKNYGALADAVSPIFLLKKTLPPTLLINGQDDKITPAIYAQRFADLANSFANNCKLILLPNTGHAFAVPHYKSSETQVLNALQLIESFLINLGYMRGPTLIKNSNDSNWISTNK